MHAECMTHGFTPYDTYSDRRDQPANHQRDLRDVQNWRKGHFVDIRTCTPHSSNVGLHKFNDLSMVSIFLVELRVTMRVKYDKNITMCSDHLCV